MGSEHTQMETRVKWLLRAEAGDVAQAEHIHVSRALSSIPNTAQNQAKLLPPNLFSQAWWHIPIILDMRRQRQGDQVSL